MAELRQYIAPDGSEPFNTWLDGIRNKLAQTRIRFRLRQLEIGNFGDCEAVGNGVLELRVHIGAGYRVYCARHGNELILLLCGGDKRTQDSDIKRAKLMWDDWKERKP